MTKSIDITALRSLAERLEKSAGPDREIDAALHRLLGGPVSPATVQGTYRMVETEYWKCFHCGETFHLDQLDAAREHFGPTPNHVPLCCSYTGSVDAATALLLHLLPRWDWTISNRMQANLEPPQPWCWIYDPLATWSRNRGDEGPHVEQVIKRPGATPAIAIASAIVGALIAQAEAANA